MKTPSEALESYKKELDHGQGGPAAGRIWKESLFWVLLFCGVLLIMGMQGCAPAGYVSLDAVDPVIRRVVARHQDYVREDETLSKTDREVSLLEGELLIEELNAAREAGENGR